MDSIKYSAPIVVCGMPRSGTTLTGELIRTCRVEVFSEARLPGLTPLLRQLRMAMQTPWRRVDTESHDERLCAVIYEAWRAVTSDSRYSSNALRYATKTPAAELGFSGVDKLLEVRKPIYIYCARDPAAVYESLLNVKWGQGNSPKQILNRFHRSYSRVLDLSERMLVFDVDRASRDREYREQWTRSVVDKLNIEYTRQTERFLEAWPPVNTRRPDHAGSISERAIARRLRRFRKKARRKGLDELYQRVLDNGLGMADHPAANQ